MTQALNGHFGAHHAVLARRILDHLDFLDASIATINDQVATRTEPFEALIEALMKVPGLHRLTIETVIAETGADMSRF